MEWNHYILFGIFSACLFFGGGAYALVWAWKNGQLTNMSQGACSIFDEDEPQGEVTDKFPVRRKRRKFRGQPTEE
ncbi:MAG: cbb3-type cytochrome oxidase assembly protein [Puniceicoccaceae bacterium]